MTHRIGKEEEEEEHMLTPLSQEEGEGRKLNSAACIKLETGESESCSQSSLRIGPELCLKLSGGAQVQAEPGWRFQSGTRLSRLQRHEQFYAHANMHQMFHLSRTSVVYASHESQSWSATSIGMPTKIHLQHVTTLSTTPQSIPSRFDSKFKQDVDF